MKKKQHQKKTQTKEIMGSFQDVDFDLSPEKRKGKMKMVEDDEGGLGNKTVLDKVDKLRALNVGMSVPLPQVDPRAQTHLMRALY